jgi:hypothetical protein
VRGEEEKREALDCKRQAAASKTFRWAEKEHVIKVRETTKRSRSKREKHQHFPKKAQRSSIICCASFLFLVFMSPFPRVQTRLYDTIAPSATEA